MAYFNQTLFADIRKTVYEVYEELKHGRATREHLTEFVNEKHDFVKKISDDIALQALFEEYEQIPITAKLYLLIRRATHDFESANTILNGWARFGIRSSALLRKSYGHINYRLYVNANPFHIGDVLRELFELFGVKFCPYYKHDLMYYGMKKCAICGTLANTRTCPKCNAPLSQNAAYCRGCQKEINNPITFKFHYAFKSNPSHNVQEMLKTNKLVFYFGEPVSDIYLWVNKFRAMPSAWFGHHVPRFTKIVAKGVGFGANPGLNQTGESSGTSIGMYFSALGPRILNQINKLVALSLNKQPNGDEHDLIRLGHIVLKNQHLDYIAMEIYEEVGTYAQRIFHPFEN